MGTTSLSDLRRGLELINNAAAKGGSVEDIWGIHPDDINEKNRSLVWKSLLFITHPDRHASETDEIKNMATEATKGK